MRTVRGRSVRLRVRGVVASVVSLVLLCLVAGYGYGQTPPAQKGSEEPALPWIVEKARGAQDKVQLRAATDGLTPVDVVPGGDDIAVQAPVAADGKTVYRAQLLGDRNREEDVDVISSASKQGPKGAQVTELVLSVPDLGFGPRKKMTLVVVSFPVGADGKALLDKPRMSAEQLVRVSNKLFSTSAAVVAVIIAYLLAVLAVGRIGKSHAWSPVYLTSGFSDRASLSQFQIFGFTLLVFGLLVYILFRMGILPNISSDILLLLGISAVGTAGSKVAGVMKKRLSSENWAWLRNNGWLTAYEAGADAGLPDKKRARWGDLLKTDGSFDVYSFQLAAFSVLVGYSLLTSDLKTLSTFTIPANLLALLGLSNVVYIGGKAVAPNSIGELDEKLTALRPLETDWIKAVAKETAPLADQPAKRKKACDLAQDKCQTYVAAAREAARMLKSTYGAGGTKFKDEPITEEQVLPQFP